MTQPANTRAVTEDRIAAVSSATPANPGVAAPGAAASVSRGDHVHNSLGLFMPWGTGYDGDLNFDGTTTVTVPDPWSGGTVSFVPSGNVYTITQPISGRIITLGNGVTLACNQGATIFASEELRCPSGSAIISADGNNAVADVAGAARAVGLRYATGAGGAGQTGAGTQGGVTSNPTDQWQAALGGAGGLGSGGAGGAAPSGNVIQNKLARHSLLRDANALLQGAAREQGVGTSALLLLTGSGGGGGGGGDGVAKGGGGGGPAGILLVNAKKITGNIVFRAIGGNGGNGAGTNCGGGGGGGGGYVFVNSADMTGYTGPCVGANGTSGGSRATHCAGGTGGTKTGTGVAGTAGQSGWIFMTTWK